jgi:hypothetical protein
MGRSRDLWISSDHNAAPHSVCRLGTSNEGRIAGSETRELSPDERTVLQEVADGHAGCQGKREFFHRLRIGIANCCAGKKFRSTVDLGSFPFRYKTRGSGTPGEELRGIRCAAEVACPFAELSAGRHLLPGPSRAKRRWGKPSDLSHVKRESRGMKRSRRCGLPHRVSAGT